MNRGNGTAPRTGEWTAHDMPAQTGRTVVITGATSGIGLAAAHALHHAGADVVLAVRNEVKGRAAANRIASGRAPGPGTQRLLRGGSVSVRIVDLADLASVRRFAAGWTGRIDLLIANAGVMMPPLQRTADGFELQIGTNHLGHFALTNLLLPYVRDRVLTVASLMERAGRIDLGDLNHHRRRYRPAAAYGQSKLANLLTASHLQTLLTAAGSPVRSVAAHPGAASTGLGVNLTVPGATGLFRIGSRLVGQDPAGGCLPTLFAATENLPGGSFIGPRGRFQLRGAPTAVGRSPRAHDERVAEELWGLSERLTGTRFPLNPRRKAEAHMRRRQS